MRRIVGTLVALAGAGLAAAALAAGPNLDPRVQQAVDRADAADKAAAAAADLAKQAASDAVKAARRAIDRASAARGAVSTLAVTQPKEGFKIQGQMRNGKLNGLCIVETGNGVRYEGECRDGGVAGFGVEVDPSGARYEGAYEGGKRQGSGRGSYADGSRYEGQWLGGGRSGYGIIVSANGDTYRGHVLNGRADGSGIRRMPDGTGYSGDWRESKADGFGLHALPGGSAYIGQWAQNKYNGAGIFVSPAEKKIVQGLWEAGVLKQELGPAIAMAPPGQPKPPGESKPPDQSKPPGAPPAKSAPGAAQAAKPDGPKLYGIGTGFYVSKAGHLVTNDHVTRGCKSLRVHAVGEPSVAVRLVATTQKEDLSLLKTAEPPETIAAIRSGPQLRPGDGVVVFGFPLAGIIASTGNLTTGNVAALAGPGDSTDLIQISAQIQPGNSGGAALDLSGNVIGIVELTLDTPKAASVIGANLQNVNFAIKASVLESFLQAHSIAYQRAESAVNLSVADVGERARAFSVMVECYR
jgi:S1-C subfamily serine protease